MPRIEIAIEIAAPPDRCFDLARSVEAHVRSTAATGERPIAGTTAGLLTLGDEVTWRARHFGFWQELTSRITAYDRPRFFRDSQVRGAFAWFEHEHRFEAYEGGTRMHDIFEYEAPFGPFGTLAERLVLTHYMRRFLMRRQHELQQLAESGEWVQLLPLNSRDDG